MCDQSWRTFYVHLKKNVYSTALGCATNKYQLSLPDLMSHLRPVFPCWSPVWMISPLMKVGFYSPPLLLCCCCCLLLRLLAFALYVEVLLCWVRVYLDLWPRSLSREPSWFTVVPLLSCVWLCNPVDCSTPGFPVFHYLSPWVWSHFCPLSW